MKNEFKDKIVVGVICLLVGMMARVDVSYKDDSCHADLARVQAQNARLERKLDKKGDRKEVFELFAKFIDKIPFEQAVGVEADYNE